MKDDRTLADLCGIGKAMLGDFERLGVTSVAQLARKNPDHLYARLNRLTGQKQDICVLDVFRAAVAQAKNPKLPKEKCNWWYWSGVRKGESKKAVDCADVCTSPSMR